MLPSIFSNGTSKRKGDPGTNITESEDEMKVESAIVEGPFEGYQDEDGTIVLVQLDDEPKAKVTKVGRSWYIDLPRRSIRLTQREYELLRNAFM